MSITISDNIMLFKDYQIIFYKAISKLKMHGGRGFIRQTSQANKALQDQEEWINELKRFDFDRIHSTTNLRTYALI